MLHRPVELAQYLSVAYGQRLADAGITPSVSAISSYDNALAESINGLYKTEVIRRQGPWRNLDTVEIAATHMLQRQEPRARSSEGVTHPWLVVGLAAANRHVLNHGAGLVTLLLAAASHGHPQARTGPGCGGRWRWPKLPRVAGRAVWQSALLE